MTAGFGADYTFEATGLVAVMRQAVESARMGWGQCVVAGVAGRGETLDIIPRFLITGRRVAGASFGGARGRDNVPELAQLYLDGKLPLEQLHLPPRAARAGQRRVRPDAPPGRDPHRPDVRLSSGRPGEEVRAAQSPPALGSAPMTLPPLLHSLLTSHGPSGYEAAPAAVWRDAAREFSDDVAGDVMGSRQRASRAPATARRWRSSVTSTRSA